MAVDYLKGSIKNIHNRCYVIRNNYVSTKSELYMSGYFYLIMTILFAVKMYFVWRIDYSIVMPSVFCFWVFVLCCFFAGEEVVDCVDVHKSHQKWLGIPLWIYCQNNGCFKIHNSWKIMKIFEESFIRGKLMVNIISTPSQICFIFCENYLRMWFSDSIIGADFKQYIFSLKLLRSIS